MSESMTATAPSTEVEAAAATAVAHAEAIAWLSSEFPAWEISIDTTSGWNGVRRELWEALRIDHHPQRALTPGKLYRRLDEYEDRERERAHLAAKVL